MSIEDVLIVAKDLREKAITDNEKKQTAFILDFIESQQKTIKELEETIKNLQCCGNCYSDPTINNIPCEHHGACRSFFWTKDESLTDYWQDKSS